MKVERENMEHRLSALTGEEIRYELIEEGSIFYKATGDLAAVLYSGLAVLVLGTIQPQAIQGLKDHEPIFQKMRDDKQSAAIGSELGKYGLKRLKESVELVGGIVFAAEEQDRADASFALRELHRKVAGRLDDGTPYHAWQPEVWAHAWAGIFRGAIESYETFRGFNSSQERDELLIGFVELGKLFGVKGVPDTWVEFDPYWDDYISNSVVEGPVTQIALIASNGYITKNLYRLLQRGKFKAAGSLLLLSPFIRLARVGALTTFPEQISSQLNIVETPLDRIEVTVHKACWACVPKALSSRFMPALFKVMHSTGGEPVWKTRFSRANLNANIKTTECIDAIG